MSEVLRGRGAEFPEDVFRHFCHDKGCDVMMNLDQDTKYRQWLATTIPSKVGLHADAAGIGCVQVWQLSASRAVAAGWRAVLQKDLEDKVGMLSASGKWSNATEDRLVLFLPGQIGAKGDLQFYVTGLHRGSALHAMLAVYFY